MAYGDPITDPIPAVGLTGTAYASQVNALLSTMKTTLSAKVELSNIDPADAALDMNNQAVQNAQYAGFYEQSDSPSGTPYGRIVYYGGNFYMVTSSGTIQVTTGTTLNVSTTGGIVGDYGSSGRLVSYEDANEIYHFYDDQTNSEYAKLKARGLDLINDGTSDTIRVKPRATIAASYDLDLPAAPPAAGVSLLSINDSGQMDLAESAAITNPFTADVKHGNIDIVYPAVGVEKVNVSNFNVEPGTLGVLTGSAATGEVVMFLPAPPVGRRLKTIAVGGANVAGSTMTVTVYRTTGVAENSLGTNNSASVGDITVTATCTWTAIANNYLKVRVQFAGGGAGNVKIYSITLTYDYV